MDLLTLMVVIGTTYLVYSFTRDRYLLAAVCISYTYVGMMIMIEGITCTASAFCHSGSTLIDPLSTLAYVLFIIVTFGSIINIFSEFTKRRGLVN